MTNNSAEYTMLKNEIQEKIGAIHTCRNILYTSVIAIFAFGFNNAKEPLIFLIAYMVIIPTYIVNMEETKSFLRIGAYIIVFLEDDTLAWESRLYEYDNMFSKHPKTKSQISHFSFCNICCALVCIVRCFTSSNASLVLKGALNNSDIIYFSSRIIIALFCYISTILMMEKHRVNYTKIKQGYIDEWILVKRKEKKKTALEKIEISSR